MGGDLLTIAQIAEMAGCDGTQVNKALRKGDLIDQSPSQVAAWLQGRFEAKIAKKSGRRDKRSDRSTTVHRKWD